LEEVKKEEQTTIERLFDPMKVLDEQLSGIDRRFNN